MPFTQDEKNEMLKGESIIVYGAFSEKNELMSVSGLFPDPSNFGDLTELLKLNPAETTELGGCMTRPKFRGQNLMLRLNEYLLSVAKNQGYKNLIATAHPENTASGKSLEKLGMKKVGQVNRSGKYLRDVFYLGL